MKIAFKYIKNKYVIISTILLLHLLITEETNLFQLISERQQIGVVKKENDKKRQEIVDTKRAIEELTTNKQALEKFAREQYFMKKKNEDVFIFIEK